MNSTLQIFNKDNFTVRTINEDGEIWFVAKDVMTALEYSEDSNPARIMQSVPEIWRGVKRIHTTSDKATARPYQDMLCLSEQDLYFFLGRSDKPKALPYQIWVAGEVIPSIRETGSYSVNKMQASLPSGVLEGAKFILEYAGITGNQCTLALDKVYKSYTGQSLLLTAGIELKAPVKEQALTASELAELIGVGTGRKGAIVINKMLELKGFQRRIGKYWEPTERGKEFAVVMDMNKRHSDGTPVRQVKWNTSIRNLI